MKTILYRYLLVEQLAPLGTCFLGLTLILITGRLLQLTRLLFTSSLTVGDVLEVMALAMPELILYALPMATLTGVLLGFVRLNSDNELIAFRAAGVGFKQFLPPVLTVLFLTTCLSFVNTFYMIPSANLAFKEKLRTMGRAGAPALLKEGTFIDIIPNLVFFFRSVNTSDLSIEGIFVQDCRKSDAQISIVAERAQLITQHDTRHITFKIKSGVITRVGESMKDAQAIGFKSYDLVISLDEVFGEAAATLKGKREMTLAELLKALAWSGRDQEARLSLEIHRRLALPFGCLVLGLLGAPLGSLFRQRSRMTGVTLGLASFLAYYILLSAGNGLGKNRILSPSLAMWIPNIIAFLMACYLWKKMHGEVPFEPSVLWDRYRLQLHNLLRRPRTGKGHDTHP